MKLRKVMAWTLASAMFAGLLAGCGGSTQTTETAAAESGSEEGGSSAEGGKVLRYQASTLVDSLDPALSNDYTSSGVISQFMMGLMTKDESGAPVYGVAESEEKSEDGLTLTFKIRDDAKWSNGDPVTANDFVYAWRRVADPATASDYQFFITTACIANAEEVTTGEKPVEELGVEAADDKTLVVTLSSPCAIFDYLMASCALVCQILCFLPVAYYQVKYQHQFPDLLMCICVCSITVREMVGLWRPELSEIASKIQCVIAFTYFISAFRKAFRRTNELQSMTDEMKRQNNVKDSDSPADAGEGEKNERNDEIRD